MTSNEIKKEFLRFFEDKGHKIVPSSSLIPDDPTLLLTTAGMVQFKPYFLNIRQPSFTRATSVQKCVRTTDIDLVGQTARHLTFFEMLGNFSFGDYYKKEAIAWAWEMITKIFNIDPARLWVSVYLDDDEAFDIWKNDIRVSPDRIVRLGEKDNFWAAGPTGPCGPCSEIHYDFGEDKKCQPSCQLGCDCDRFIEIWNLVFMEFNRQEDGSLEPLPKKNIDTGIGVERTALVLQGAANAFETDLLRPLISKVEELSGITYGSSTKNDISLRIIADHVRAITFLVNDGIMPSNEGRGYILRRLLRRAARHGRSLGIEDDFLVKVVEVVIDSMSPTYSELIGNKAFIDKVVENEESRFSSTLRQGMTMLHEECEDLRRQAIGELSGEVAFKLYDTYGFPFEITKEIAEDYELTVDDTAFEKLMHEQKQRAKSGAAFSEAHSKIRAKTVFDELGNILEPTEFCGYTNEKMESVVKAIIINDELADSIQERQAGFLVLESTPFYAEQGGQSGDTGNISSDKGTLEVTGVSLKGGLYIHNVTVKTGEVHVNDKVTAVIDADRRKATSRNHTATHILHWALRKVLGDHVKQAGSAVGPARLRFDFSHYEAMTQEQLDEVEVLVNEKIFSDDPVRCYTTSIDYAKSGGALAFFGDKYSDFVRVVESGDFSKELCGGTHVSNTGNIKLFTIQHEGSVGSNIRRIEALTGKAAYLDLAQKAKAIMAISKDIGTTYDRVADRILQLEKEIKSAPIQKDSLPPDMADAIEKLMAEIKDIGQFRVLAKDLSDMPDLDIKEAADLVRDRHDNIITIFGNRLGDKAFLVCTCSDVAIKMGADAGLIIKTIAEHINGKGGGKSRFAQAGGSLVEGIDKALDAAVAFIENLSNESSSA